MMKQFSFQPELFTIEAAAHYLGVSPRTVEYYIAETMLETWRMPATSKDKEGEYLKRTLIRRAQLDAFIDRWGISV